MLLSVTLDDANGTPVALHETTKRALTHVDGLAGISAPRQSVRDRPTAHGSIDETHWTGGKNVNLEGEVMSNVSVADALAEFRLCTGAMLQTLDNGPALLKWTEGNSGLALQMLVKLASDVNPAFEEAAAIIRYQAQFLASDPRAYSQTLQTASSAVLAAVSGGMTMPFRFPFTFASSSGGTVSVTNNGNRPTPAVLTVDGYVLNPTVLLSGTSQKIAMQGTVSPGTSLSIDTQVRSLAVGAASAYYLLDAANTSWFLLPVGTSTLRLLASDFDTNARLTVAFRDAYA